MERTLYDWAAEASTALDLPDELRWVADKDVVQQVLDLARDVAQGVARPGAPVGAFLAGVAVGLQRSAGPEALEDVRGRLAPTFAGEASGGSS
ncbi:MAG: hypothetical protein QOD81_305 [Solirubrobacteraceae bacterium]|jgi:hypothetical protein|nr:hypothetical protein [Solirubrobacteraceae bacterium]